MRQAVSLQCCSRWLGRKKCTSGQGQRGLGGLPCLELACHGTQLLLPGCHATGHCQLHWWTDRCIAQNVKLQPVTASAAFPTSYPEITHVPDCRWFADMKICKPKAVAWDTNIKGCAGGHGSAVRLPLLHLQRCRSWPRIAPQQHIVIKQKQLAKPKSQATRFMQSTMGARCNGWTVRSVAQSVRLPRARAYHRSWEHWTWKRRRLSKGNPDEEFGTWKPSSPHCCNPWGELSHLKCSSQQLNSQLQSWHCPGAEKLLILRYSTTAQT